MRQTDWESHINVLPGLPGRFAPNVHQADCWEREILKKIERIIKGSVNHEAKRQEDRSCDHRIFCTYEKVFQALRALKKEEAELQTIFSDAAQAIDSRFGNAEIL